MKFVTRSAFDGAVEMIATGHRFLGVRLERPVDRLSYTPTAYVMIAAEATKPRVATEINRRPVRLLIFESLRALDPRAKGFYFIEENNCWDAEYADEDNDQ